MQIVWSAEAIANLIEIREYIAQDNPGADRRVVKRILSSVERLARHPHLGAPGREPGTRELVLSGMPYIVPYRVDKGRLAVLAVLHTSQENAPRR